MSDRSVFREFDEAEGDARAVEFEQVARNTSRKLLTLLGIAGALLLVIHFTPLGQRVRDWNTLAELFTTGGYRGAIYFVLISSFLILAGVPRLLLCSLGGFAFGFREGLSWSLFSSLIGSFIAFRAARWGGRDWLVERFGKRRLFGRIVHAEPTIVSIVLIRMLPVSSAVINFGLALSVVEDRVFLFGSLVGFLPEGVVTVVLGSGLADDVPWAGTVQIAAAGTLALAIFLWTLRHWRNLR